MSTHRRTISVWLATALICAAPLAGRSSTDPSTVYGSIDPDNVQVLFTGDEEGSQLTLRGSGWGPYAGAGTLPLLYDFTTDEPCLYLVAWSDDQVIQGVLQDLRVDGSPIWFDYFGWAVYPTGSNRDDYLSDPLPTEQEVSAHVQAANDGADWRPISLGERNDGHTFPPRPCCCFPATPGIDQNARWAWYDSGLASGSCQPFSDGFDHHEYLIFRFCVNSPVSVDEATWGRLKATYR